MRGSEPTAFAQLGSDNRGLHPFDSPLEVPLARPWLDGEEQQAVLGVIASGQLCQGEVTDRFEAAFAQYIGSRYAVSVSSGSAALLVSLQALGIAAADEVIVPDITFISTATAVLYAGGKPVLADIGLDDYCIDTARLNELVTPNTKAIIPVHLGGRLAEIELICQFAAEHNLRVLEDAAGAHGVVSASGQHAGTFGDLGIFSFTPSKLMTTGEGGMIVTDNPELAQRCRRIRNFGDVGKFQWNDCGFNFRMTAVSATLGIAQLQKLASAIAMRREIANFYRRTLINEALIQLPSPAEDCNWQLFPILLDVDGLGRSRDEVVAELAAHGVATRLYYPALHRQPVLAKHVVCEDSRFPRAVEYERRALCLPVFAGMTTAQQNHVVSALREVLRLSPGFEISSA